MVEAVSAIVKQHETKKRIVAILYICFGAMITLGMSLIFVWPGILAHLLLPTMKWLEGEGLGVALMNILLGVSYFLLTIVAFILVMLAPFIAAAFVLADMFNTP